MARPLKTGLDYFSHDTEAHADQKIQSLMALYGAKGYAFYFIMLEKVFRSENGRITAGKPSEKAGLARAMCLTLKEFDQILETALEVGCFDSEEYKKDFSLTSTGVQKRIGKVTEEREKDRLRRESHLLKLKDLKEKQKEKEKPKRGKLPDNPRKTICLLPEDFAISENIKLWAKEKGYDRLTERLEHFKDWAKGGSHKKADWEATFRNAIRGDWAKLKTKGNGNNSRPGRVNAALDKLREIEERERQEAQNA